MNLPIPQKSKHIDGVRKVRKIFHDEIRDIEEKQAEVFLRAISKVEAKKIKNIKEQICKMNN